MADLEDFEDLDDFDDEDENESADLEESGGKPDRKQQGQKGPKPNLYESAEFRAYQAAQDRRIAEMEQKHKREAEERERVLLAKMSDGEKRDYDAAKQGRRIAELERQIESERLSKYQAQVIFDIRAETGAPLDAIDTSSEAAAIRSAYKWRDENKPKRSRKRDSWDEEEPDDEEEEWEDPPKKRRRTDLGSGKAGGKHTPKMRLRAEYQAALKSGDVFAAIQVSDRAKERGINLQNGD